MEGLPQWRVGGGLEGPPPFEGLKPVEGLTFLLGKLEPMPSTVVTEHQSAAQSGMRQALAEKCRIAPLATSRFESITVHAPQPPSLHPSFVPVSPIDRSHSRSVVVGSTLSTSCRLPLTCRMRVRRNLSMEMGASYASVIRLAAGASAFGAADAGALAPGALAFPALAGSLDGDLGIAPG